MHEQQQQRTGKALFSNISVFTDRHTISRHPHLILVHPDGAEIIVGVVFYFSLHLCIFS